MIKRLIYIIPLLLSIWVEAQEVLLPISYNPQVARAGQLSSLKSGQVSQSLMLPFFDDFRRGGPFPDKRLWSDRNVFVGQHFAIFPPNYGVATFDALDSTGYVYKHAAYTAFEADRLTSQPIRLDSVFVPIARPLRKSDSIYLSFFYQPQGKGNPPQKYDSLLLYFFSPKDYTWNRIWAAPGMPLDTFKVKTGKYWGFVNIWISDSSKYYHKGFRFRFVAYASLANNILPSWQSSMDQWNLDYVLLNKNRHKFDSTFRDLGFVDVSPTMLKNYISMPYTHYSNDPTREMNDTLSVIISNLDVVAHPSNYGYTVFDGSYQKITSYTGGGYAVYPVYDSGYVKYKPYARPRISSILPIDPLGIKDSADFYIRHVIVGDYTPDDRLYDTLELKLIFRNYFAYDDGTPEAGYGVSPAGAMGAVRYTLNMKDTLRAVKIYFNPTHSGSNQQYFHLLVWDDNNGIPGKLLYDSIVRPEFSDVPHDFQTFILQKIVVVRNAFFVGWMNTTNDNLNMGFDLSRDNRANNFFNVDGQWRTSQYAGSLMIRPVVGKALPGNPKPVLKVSQLVVSPNPLTGQELRVRLPASFHGAIVELYALSGQLVYSALWSETLQLPILPGGMYLLKVILPDGSLVGTAKLIIRR
ncbi:MAG: T9SS type A sorting domain-containing protein [Bacteroidales bacterium]